MTTPGPSTLEPFGMRVIVVAVDGSPPASKAIQEGIDLASRYRARLVFVSVVASPSRYMVSVSAPQPNADLTEYFRLGAENARKAVDAAVQLAKAAGIDVAGQVIDSAGSVVEAITDLAQRERADLIVIGTRGLGGFKKLLLGSVSSGVVSHAPCAVLLVR